MKQFIKEQLRAILNVGFSSRMDTAGSKDVKHDQYVEALRDWLHSFGANWAEQPLFSILQGLNDRGVDLKIEFKVAKLNIGVQVKSYGDISDEDFSKNIWQQIGQFRSYAINHFFIVLCGDMTNPSHYQKVRHFQSSLEQGNYPEITVISPEQAWRLYESFDSSINVDEVQKRLTNIARFMEIINRSQELSDQYSVYLNIEQIFVPPIQYTDIQKALYTNDIVIIVGPPHVGKTFTAVKLLYEYFLKGYQPYWMLGRADHESLSTPNIQDIYHLQGIRDSFSLESRLQPGCIVYFEDPYGRTRQEEIEFIANENLFEIGDFIHILKRRANAEKRPKIIITSREGIFRFAVQKQPELSRYAIWLKAGRGYSDNGAKSIEEKDVSYDFNLRVRIAQNYEHLYKPTWSQFPGETFENAKEKLEEVLSLAVSYLWTPHSMQRFFHASQNMDLGNIEVLHKTIFKSTDISKAFASEIALLPEPQRLVFVIIYLVNHHKTMSSDWGNTSSVLSKYLAVAEILGVTLDDGQLAWSQVLKDQATIIDEIGVPGGHGNDQSHVRFAHPAYDEAVAQFLSDNPDVLENIFREIRSLVTIKPGIHIAHDMVWLLHHWYRDRPSIEADILRSYMTSNDIGLLMDLAEMYASFYAFVEDQRLNAAIQTLLTHSADNTGSLRGVFLRKAHTASYLPLDKRCKILFLALGDEPLELVKKFRYRPYDLICRYYSEISDQARDNLHSYFNKGSNVWQVLGRSFGNYYDFLPQFLQDATNKLVTQNTPGSFIYRQEVIKGFILGYKKFNIHSHQLMMEILKNGEPRTRAYFIGALVPIFEYLDDDMSQLWHNLVERDCDHCAVAAAKMILYLSEEQSFAETFKRNRLLDFAIAPTRSDSPAVRAAMVGLLPANSKPIFIDDLDEAFVNLIYDDNPIVRGATLFRMLNSFDLQAKFPERFQILLSDTSEYIKLSKLIYLTNPSTKPHLLTEEETTIFKFVESGFVYNALLFHVSAQLPFLQPHWSEWLDGELKKDIDITKRIINFGKWYRSDDASTRPIFEPDWLLDYSNPDQLFYYVPQMNYIILKRPLQDHAYVIIKNLDEIAMIFRMRRDYPDYLECH